VLKGSPIGIKLVEDSLSMQVDGTGNWAYRTYSYRRRFARFGLMTRRGIRGRFRSTPGLDGPQKRQYLCIWRSDGIRFYALSSPCENIVHPAREHELIRKFIFFGVNCLGCVLCSIGFAPCAANWEHFLRLTEIDPDSDWSGGSLRTDHRLTIPV
jgi:hypothetical protein